VVEVQTRRISLATRATFRGLEPVEPFGATVVETLVSSPGHSNNTLCAMPFPMAVVAQHNALCDLGFSSSEGQTSHVADRHHFVDQVVEIEAHRVPFRTPRAPSPSFEILHPVKTSGIESQSNGPQTHGVRFPPLGVPRQYLRPKCRMIPRTLHGPTR
jgi:hypothetical protein